MNQFPLSPRVFHKDRFKFFPKIHRNILKSRCTTGINKTGCKFGTGVNDTGGNMPPVSTTPAANFSTSFTSDVDTGGKCATSVNDDGGKQWEQLSNW
jgi:hypothetical protein